MTEPTYVDISRPLGSSIPVWPGDTPPRLDRVLRLAAGDTVNLSTLSMSAHTGTHADAPFHVMDSGEGIGGLPIAAFVGRAVVVDARDRPSIDSDLVGRTLAARPPPRRILFRTGAWVRPDEFPTIFAAIDPPAATLLAEAGVMLVGTDAPSVDPFDSIELPAHKTLAAAGIANLENLLLDGIPEGEYELIALPLRLDEGDGSPVRAVLRIP
ncbi:MAG: cyclase family protein [Gemmatimonadota bacterium]